MNRYTFTHTHSHTRTHAHTCDRNVGEVRRKVKIFRRYTGNSVSLRLTKQFLCTTRCAGRLTYIYIYLFTAALAREDIEEETEAWRGLHMVTFLTVHQSRTRQPFLSGLCIIITFRQTRGVRDLQAWKMPEAGFDGIVWEKKNLTGKGWGWGSPRKWRRGGWPLFCCQCGPTASTRTWSFIFETQSGPDTEGRSTNESNILNLHKIKNTYIHSTFAANVLLRPFPPPLSQWY